MLYFSKTAFQSHFRPSTDAVAVEGRSTDWKAVCHANFGGERDFVGAGCLLELVDAWVPNGNGRALPKLSKSGIVTNSETRSVYGANSQTRRTRVYTGPLSQKRKETLLESEFNFIDANLVAWSLLLLALWCCLH